MQNWIDWNFYQNDLIRDEMAWKVLIRRKRKQPTNEIINTLFHKISGHSFSRLIIQPSKLKVIFAANEPGTIHKMKSSDCLFVVSVLMHFYTHSPTGRIFFILN